LQHSKYAAYYLEPDEPDTPLDQAAPCSNLYDDGQSILTFVTQVIFSDTVVKGLQRGPILVYFVSVGYF